MAKDRQQVESAGKAPQAAPSLPAAAPPPPEFRRGVYFCMLRPYVRHRIDTGLPAGPEAEAVARDRYLAAMDIVPRPGVNVELTLAG